MVVALLVTLPLGSQGQSLLMTPCHLMGEEGLRHSLASLSAAFCGVWSSLPHCRLWTTLARVFLLTASGRHYGESCYCSGHLGLSCWTVGDLNQWMVCKGS